VRAAPSGVTPGDSDRLTLNASSDASRVSSTTLVSSWVEGL
jgi:hypothetical protein